MKWKIEFWEMNEDEEMNAYTNWADSFFEAFGFFTSCAMDENCRKCVVTAYYSGKPYGDTPVLVYDNS